MPAGCDFICVNEECENHLTCFVMTGAWAMGDIDEVIASKKVQSDKEVKASFERLKEQGRRYACINYPDNDNIEVKAYRIQKWCPSCSCLWMYDVVLSSKSPTLDEALDNSTLPTECPQCETELISFHDAIAEGLDCPKCHEKLQQTRWGCSEVVDTGEEEDVPTMEMDDSGYEVHND